MLLPIPEQPVEAIDGIDPKYRNDHLKYFFENEIYPNLLTMTDEQKHRYFTLQRNHEGLLYKIYGHLNDIMGVVFLPTALDIGISNQLVYEYKHWLEKQNG